MSCRCLQHVPNKFHGLVFPVITVSLDSDAVFSAQNIPVGTHSSKQCRHRLPRVRPNSQRDSSAGSGKLSGTGGVCVCIFVFVSTTNAGNHLHMPRRWAMEWVALMRAAARIPSKRTDLYWCIQQVSVYTTAVRVSAWELRVKIA